MPQSKGRSAFGRRPGTVTVIEEPVRRSAARNAKIIAIITWIITGLLASAVLSDRWHPVLAVLAGSAIGLVAAMLATVAIITWPVVRAIWWWSAEISTGLGLTGGWIWLSDHTTVPYRIAIALAAGGIPAAIPPVRRRITAWAWCVITRHRVRTCFTEFIITNRTGTLPLILWTRPTPVGERVWLWLRPGLSLDDIQDRLDLIAVACWASAATAEAASEANSARIRLDIKRRDALTATIGSPLLALAEPGDASSHLGSQPVPDALDLPDVTAADVAAPVKTARKEPRAAARMPVPAIAPDPAAGSDDDITDWV